MLVSICKPFYGLHSFSRRGPEPSGITLHIWCPRSVSNRHIHIVSGCALYQLEYMGIKFWWGMDGIEPHATWELGYGQLQDHPDLLHPPYYYTLVPPTGFEPTKTLGLSQLAVPIYISHRGIKFINIKLHEI